MANVLIHTCCAPCATYTVEHWRGQGLQLAALWFNPNIHPYQEHERRLKALDAFCRTVEMPFTRIPGYRMVDFLREVVGHEAGRCADCFRLRLSQTAQKAREMGMDAFTTTLLISPYQKHELLREVGEAVGVEQRVRFLYEDLRLGYHRSRTLSREQKLYRQQYCGCIYSEWERFARVSIVEDTGPGYNRMSPDPRHETG